MSQFFESGAQSTGASTSAPVLPMNIQGWFLLGLTGLISLLSKGFSRISPVSKFESINSSAPSFLHGPSLTSYMINGKTITFTIWTFVYKVMFLLFNRLSRWVIAFLPRNKCLLISWLQSPAAVILEHKEVKSVTVSIVSPCICHELMGLDAWS